MITRRVARRRRIQRVLLEYDVRYWSERALTRGQDSVNYLLYQPVDVLGDAMRLGYGMPELLGSVTLLHDSPNNWRVVYDPSAETLIFVQMLSVEPWIMTEILPAVAAACA